ncbi:OLC1v1014274C1 [Oldenlandia corymbosa var. corymbosa]|uniref:OLC1v1014274C1 n=1 Tax=Oldenlandia corymbosa var. corymbosa TaxID=529605 RepID=A0AAV1E3M1_OLDCO|nr:OLC1v1014274C1 [Oldenlandia corymbosa var. corymbosa]
MSHSEDSLEDFGGDGEDYRILFATDEEFAKKDDAVAWVKGMGMANDMLINVVSSKKKNTVLMRCCKGGNVSVDDGEYYVTSDSKTQITGCKFKLYVHLVDGKWRVRVYPGEQNYYNTQISTIKSMEDVDALLVEDGVEEKNNLAETKDETAINISNYVNMVILAVKMYATIFSGSLGIVASTMDSLFDFVAGLILWICHHSLKSVDFNKFPVGKSRVQPVGIIVFATVMATIGFGVLVQATQEILEENKHSDNSPQNLEFWLYPIMLSATLLKLGLWLYCKNSKNEIVQAYAKVGLTAAIFGEKVLWWIDPIGASLLALYTIINWSRTVHENAEPELIRKLLYVAIKEPRVKRIQTVRAYTFGVQYFAEVDVELGEGLSVGMACEAEKKLSRQMERLPEIERACVRLS